MAHDQLQTIDLVIIGAYLIALVLIGVHFMKKVKNIGDYYIAGRTFGPIVMMATVCATIIGGSGLLIRHVHLLRHLRQNIRHRISAQCVLYARSVRTTFW